MLFRSISALAFSVIALVFCWSPVSARTTVLIPGIMGSRLCGANEKLLWGDRYSYTAARITALRLPSDVSQRDTSIHSCGLIDSVNIIPLLWESDQYGDLLKLLKTSGVADKDLIVFDYDWRLSNVENAARLKGVIDKLALPPNEKIDIVAHSMGGLIARLYIQSQGGAGRINNLIFLGTPHLGSASIFQRLRDGFELWPSRLSGGLAEIETTILSFPSTFELLPSYDECCGFSADADATNAKYFDVLNPEVWSRFSWLPDDFKAGGARQKALASYVKDAKTLSTLLKQPVFDNEEDLSRVHFISNAFMDTWSRVFFDPTDGKITGFRVSPGDGTVLLWSGTDGHPGDVQLSEREHARIFVGKYPEFVISEVLSGNVLHAGVAPLASVVDVQGAKHAVNSIAVSSSPEITTAAGGVELSATLALADGWPAGKQIDARWQLLRGETKIAEGSFNQAPDNQTNRLRLTSTITAPNEAGAYSLVANVPGLAPYVSTFAVVEP